MSVAVVTICLILQCMTVKSPPFPDQALSGCYLVAASWCAATYPDYDIKEIRCERYRERAKIG